MNKLKAKCRQLFAGESGGVFKGMLTLLIGAGIARLIGIGSIPILTRLYSPEDFGVLALYTSFIAILAPTLTLRYVQAIPLPKSDVMAFNLFSLCFKLIFAGSLVVAIILLLVGDVILGWFSMEVLFPWWWLIVLGAAGVAFYELFSLWATRKRQYKVIAKTQFSQSVIGNLVSIGLGILAIKPAGLIIGHFLSQSAGITSFVKNAHKDFRIYIPKVKAKKERFVGLYYQDFVWFRLPSQLLMIFAVQAPVMMMAALYTKEVTGQLSLAMMALSLPVSLIGAAMGRAYYAEMAIIGKSDLAKIRRITVDVQKKLFIVGVPIALLAIILSEPLFIIAFGVEWALAGQYAAILAPFILFQFTSSPLMEVVNVIGSQAVFLILHLLRVSGMVILFFTSSFMQVDSHLFIALLSGYLAVFYLSASALVFVMLSQKVRKI